MNTAARSFLPDFIWSVVLSGVAFGIALAIMANPTGMEMALLSALVQGRAGFVAGPLAMLSVALAAAEFQIDRSQQANAERLEALQVREFLAAHRTHAMVAIDTYDGRCETLCMQILANSDHEVAIKNAKAEGWMVYRRSSGSTCRVDENQRSLLEFVRAGFANTCAVSEKQTAVEDALILRRTDPSLTKEQGIEGFNGLIYELIERENGEDRFLGRWITGGVHVSSSAIFIVGGFRGTIDIGPKFVTAEFYSAALGIPMSGSPAPGQAPLSDLLDSLEPLLFIPNLRPDAIRVYHDIAARGSDDRIHILRPRIERFLASDDREDVKLGVTLLDSVWRIDVRFAQPYLERFLDSDDPELVTAGLRGLFNFKAEDRGFATGRLIDLAFSTLARTWKSPIVDQLRDHFAAARDPLPADARNRAMAQLAEEDLSPADVVDDHRPRRPSHA